MTKSYDFIVKMLRDIKRRFPNLSIRYEDRKINGVTVHKIKITPMSDFWKNVGYLEFEDTVEREFTSIFPNDEVVFVTKGDLTEVVNPKIEL